MWRGVCRFGWLRLSASALDSTGDLPILGKPGDRAGKARKRPMPPARAGGIPFLKPSHSKREAPTRAWERRSATFRSHAPNERGSTAAKKPWRERPRTPGRDFELLQLDAASSL